MRPAFHHLLPTALLSLATLLAFSGCTGPQSYLEPKFRGVTYNEIAAPSAPIPVVLTVTGETNGKPAPRATEFWENQITRTLAASHVFAKAPSDQPHAARLRITINNIGDIREAFSKGFRTSLTFGALGNTVTDAYVMTADFEAPDGRRYSREYRHAIYTSRGFTKPPEGIQAVALAQAPVLVTDDLVLHLLKDLRDSGYY